MKEFSLKTITVPQSEWDRVVNVIETLNEKLCNGSNTEREEYLTKKEVMQILKLGRSTVDRYIEEGLLEEVRLGRGTRPYIKKSQIELLLK